MSCSPDNSQNGDSRNTFLAAVLLFAITLTLFSQSLDFDFINYDDIVYVQYNRAVQQGLSRDGLIHAFTTYNVATWAPLTWLSYMADTTLFGNLPSSYRLTNILLHAAAGVFLFLSLKSLSKAFWPSLCVAAMFLFHPLRTESVVWISERKDVLFGLFWFLGLWAYAGYARQSTASRYCLVFLCFLCGMMSKFMMVTFPFVLLLLDFWPLGRLGKNAEEWRTKAWALIREKIPFWLASVVFFYLTSAALKSEQSLHAVTLDGGERFLRILQNYAFYIGKILWPTSLNILYPVGTVQWSMAALGGLVLVGVTLLAVWQRAKWPWLLVGWLWFIGSLAPVIGIVSFSFFSVADRYAYLPSVGLTISLVFGAAAVIRHFGWDKRIGFLAGGSVLLACVLAVQADLPRWTNSVTVFQAAVRENPHAVSWLMLGNAYVSEGDGKSALQAFSKAIELQPDLTEALNNRAFIWCSKQEYARALLDCEQSIKANPAGVQAYNARGNTYGRMGKYQQALVDYNRVIDLQPKYAAAYNNRASAFLELHQYDDARKDLERCRQLGGTPSESLVKALADVENLKPLKP